MRAEIFIFFFNALSLGDVMEKSFNSMRTFLVKGTSRRAGLWPVFSHL